MIDPMVSLAFSVQSAPGVYALLVGSGISQPSDIPTGWEVTLDLIRRVAKSQGLEPGDAPEVWYRSRYGKEPDYSDLIEELAPATGNRRQLLEAYFVPTDQDRELGRKVPTEAHKAIAQLVARGFIRVIGTPNFDRLMEQALEAEGVVHQVIATADQIRGMTPLAHAHCTVIKVHGDFLDTRIRNTRRELARYNVALARLLDRVFDDHGLIVCGWSGDWDPALRSAIERSPNRRYAMYWSAYGIGVSERARKLCDLREATIIPNRTANAFFRDLAEKVEALQQTSSNHPLSPRIAAATLKRYLPEERYWIRLEELVLLEQSRVLAELSSERFPITGVAFDQGYLGRRVLQYDAIVKTLSAMLVAGCYFGKKRHRLLWRRCLERTLQQAVSQEGDPTLENMARYPALVLAYASGIAALAVGRYRTFASLLTRGHVRYQHQDTPIILLLSHEEIIPRGDPYQPRLPGQVDGDFWVSEHLRAILREPLREYLPVEAEYRRAFGRFEYYFGLIYADQFENVDGHGWIQGPLMGPRNRHTVMKEVEEEIEEQKEQWPLLRVGLFGGKIERLRQIKAVYDKLLHARR